MSVENAGFNKNEGQDRFRNWRPDALPTDSSEAGTTDAVRRLLGDQIRNEYNQDESVQQKNSPSPEYKEKERDMTLMRELLTRVEGDVRDVRSETQSSVDATRPVTAAEALVQLDTTLRLLDTWTGDRTQGMNSVPTAGPIIDIHMGTPSLPMTARITEWHKAAEKLRGILESEAAQAE